MTNNSNLFIYFLFAFLFRLVFSFTSLGSIDLMQFNGLGFDVSHFDLNYDVPYFPFFTPVYLFNEFLESYLKFPTGLAYKFIPILFDSIIVYLAIYTYFFNIKNKYDNSNSLIFIGILGIISPVSILINCFHTQLDAVVILILVVVFFINQKIKKTNLLLFIKPALFAISILVKPYAIIFLPFLSYSYKRYSSLKDFIFDFVITYALLITFIFSFIFIFYIIGYDVTSNFHKIYSYMFKSRVQPFLGMPFSSFLRDFSLTYQYHILLIILFICYYLYIFLNKSLFLIAAIIFLTLLSFFGIAPQYMYFPIPFLLLSFSLRIFLVYSILTSMALIFYYMDPFMSHMYYENLTTFASLKLFSFLTPDLSTYIFYNSFNFLNNYLKNIQPIILIIFTIFIFIKLLKSNEEKLIDSKINIFTTYPFKFIYLLLASISIVLFLHIYKVINIAEKNPIYGSNYNIFINQWTSRLDFFVMDFSNGSIFNFPNIIMTLLFFLLIVYIVYEIKKYNSFK